MSKIKIDYSFIIIWSIFYFFDNDGLLPVFLFAAIIHECGHYFVLKIWGGELIFLRLTALGAEMRVHIMDSYVKELVMYLAGPLMNIATAYLFSILELNALAGASLVLGFFNLIPVQPLDGGKILEICLCLSPFEANAYRISRFVAIFISCLVFIVGIYVIYCTKSNITIFLIGSFLLTGQFKNNLSNLDIKSMKYVENKR